MLNMKDYDEIVKENFDLSDKYTRKFIIGLEEDAEKEQLLTALSSALYDNLVAKVDEIDFGTIPMSRGDITKVEKFNMTEQSLDLIRKLVLEYKQNPSVVDVIITAVQNMKDNKGLFIKGYALDIELPMLMYNLITLSIIRSTSLIIATCVEYISDPNTKTMRQALDKVAYKKTEEDVLFKQLVSFNTMCKNGTFVKTLTMSMKNAYHEDARFDEFNPEAEPDTLIPVQPSDEEVGDEVEVPADTFPQEGDPTPEEPPVASDPAPSEPVPGEGMDDEKMTSDDDLFDGGETEPTAAVDAVPQQAELPEVETDEPTSEPTDEPPVENEAPDVAPNPETDPELTPDDAPVIEDDHEASGGTGPNQGDVPDDTQDNNEEVPEVTDETAGRMGGMSSTGKSVTSTKFGRPGIAEGKPKAVKEETETIEEGGEEAGAKIAKAAIAALATFAVIGVAPLIAKLLLNFVRDIIYTFNFTRMKIADYWDVQAAFLDANADELEISSDMDEDKKQAVIKKQRKWAETFRKWANFFNIDKKQTENDVKKAKDEDKKNKKKVKRNDDGEDVLF